MQLIPDFDFKSLTNPKSLFRLQAKTLRQELQEQRPDTARHAAANFIRAIAPTRKDTVAVYYPTESELDTWPLVEELFGRNISVCLPVVLQKKAPLTFREYASDTDLEKGMFGIPSPTVSASEVVPNIVVCPLLAFKQDGARLGMGGGFYDRTLEQLRKESGVCAVGYAYAGQEVQILPTDKHDQKMDWIVTEREVFRVSP